MVHRRIPLLPRRKPPSIGAVRNPASPGARWTSSASLHLAIRSLGYFPSHPPPDARVFPGLHSACGLVAEPRYSSEASVLAHGSRTAPTWSPPLCQICKSQDFAPRRKSRPGARTWPLSPAASHWRPRRGRAQRAGRPASPCSIPGRRSSRRRTTKRYRPSYSSRRACSKSTASRRGCWTPSPRTSRRRTRGLGRRPSSPDAS